METLLFSLAFSELIVTGVLFWGMEYPLWKAALVSLAVIAGYMALVSVFRLAPMVAGVASGLYCDSAAEEKVRQVMDKYGLWAHAPAGLKIRLVKGDRPNACAVWNDMLGVTTALLERCTEAELAGVIAHELGHLRYYDAVYSVCAWALFAPGAVALTLVASLFTLWFTIIICIFLGEKVVEWAVSWGFTLAFLSVCLCKAFLMYRSRQSEFRADLFAASLGSEVRDGLVSFLSRHTSDRCRKPGVLDRVLGTHPPSQERIKKLTEGVAAVEA